MSLMLPPHGIVNTLRPTLANSVFDGSNDYLERSGLVNAADGDFVALHLRFRTTDTGFSFPFIGLQGSNGRIDIYSELGILGFVLRNSSGTEILSIDAIGSGLDDGSDHDFLATYNGSSGTGNVYVDGVDEKSGATVNTETTGTCDLTLTAWQVGAADGGGDKFDGGISRMALWTPANLTGFDLSSSTDRTNMITPSKAPQLGPGAIIDIYGGPDYLNAGVNFGYGGHFSMNGAVA